MLWVHVVILAIFLCVISWGTWEGNFLLRGDAAIFLIAYISIFVPNIMGGNLLLAFIHIVVLWNIFSAPKALTKTDRYDIDLAFIFSSA